MVIFAKFGKNLQKHQLCGAANLWYHRWQGSEPNISNKLKLTKTEIHNDRNTVTQKDNKKDTEGNQANSNQLRWNEMN